MSRHWLRVDAMSKTLRFLSREDVRRALSMTEAIDLMHGAFVQLSQGKAVVPVRLNMEIPKESARLLLMPAYLSESRKISVKLVSIMDNNLAHGLPYIQALLFVLDGETGEPLAIMDGELLTAVRTGAASGLATRLLAREDAQVAAIVGAGVQGRFQLEAVCEVRPIERAIIFSRSPETAERLAAEMSRELSIQVHTGKRPEELAEADIICTATTATAPVFEHRHLGAGVHINAVGAYKDTMCEIPAETIAAAKVVVDHRASCLSEAGDLMQAISQGLIDGEHIHAELGEVAADEKPARESNTEITIFKSVGNAVQDLAAACRVLENAERIGLGTKVRL